MKSFKGNISVFFLLLTLGCEVKPESIKFGEDHCINCKMKIVDPKFGGELVTTKGKIFKFDALECMVPFLKESGQEYAFMMGIAYDQPEKLVALDSLQFVLSEKFNSPMGANLAAFLQIDPSQEAHDWQSVQLKLSEK